MGRYEIVGHMRIPAPSSTAFPPTRRIHVVLPKAVIETIDHLVGQRNRSRFLTAAAEREISRRCLIDAAHEAAGSLSAASVPDWETAESIAAWVHDLRQDDLAGDEMLELLRESGAHIPGGTVPQPIPPFASREEEATFWDSHDIIDYVPAVDGGVIHPKRNDENP